MATIQFGQAYTYEIDTGTNTSGPTYTFTIKDALGTLGATKTNTRPCSSGAQYLNAPYFGGKTPAPQNMEIDITDL